MHRLHAGFTVAVEIKKDKSADLRCTLKSLYKARETCRINFTGSASTLFVSGVILPAQDYHGETLPETFVFATTYCGTFSNHINELVSTSKKGLCEIFRHCSDFPDADLVTDEYLAYYLKKHKYKSAFNSRYDCITKADVRREKNLRKTIENYVDKAQKLIVLNGLPAREVKTLIQRHIKTLGDEYEWCYKPARKTLWEIMVTERMPILQEFFYFIFILCFALLLTHFSWLPFVYNFFVSAVVIYIAGITIIGLFVGFYYLLASYITRHKYAPASRPHDERCRDIAASQLHPVLNEMTAAAPLKKGRVRRYFYSTALRIANFIGNPVMNVPTVSNIRWLVIDNRKRLVFLPNYANATDFYVRDFLNGNTPRGVNFMFTNGMGFPDAKLLYKEGITKDPEGYMNAIHAGQHITDLWYAHERHLTSDIINKNRRIRNGLFEPMNEEDAKQWLKLL